MPVEQKVIDFRNARCLTLKCPDPVLLRNYVNAKSEYNLLFRSGWSGEAAAKRLTQLYGLHPELTFTDYQVSLAQRILDGEFPWLSKRLVNRDDKGTPVRLPESERLQEEEQTSPRKPRLYGFMKQAEMFQRDEMTGLK